MKKENCYNHQSLNLQENTLFQKKDVAIASVQHFNLDGTQHQLYLEWCQFLGQGCSKCDWPFFKSHPSKNLMQTRSQLTKLQISPKKEISQKSICISIPLEICKTKKVEEMSVSEKNQEFQFVCLLCRNCAEKNETGSKILY